MHRDQQPAANFPSTRDAAREEWRSDHASHQHEAREHARSRGRSLRAARIRDEESTKEMTTEIRMLRAKY